MLRRFAGCSGAKSRPRCGKRDAVIICGFQRRADFKRAFDTRPVRLASNSGRICLDPHCHNAYNGRIKQEGAQETAEGRKSCGSSKLSFS